MKGFIVLSENRMFVVVFNLFSSWHYWFYLFYHIKAYFREMCVFKNHKFGFVNHCILVCCFRMKCG